MEASSYKLIIEDDEGRRSVVPVEIGEVSIGRHEGNTVRLRERNVSRRHARIMCDDGGIFAEDLDSYNGVFINGDRIAGRHEIHNGDLIKIGDFHLELRGQGLASREETTQRMDKGHGDAEVTQPNIRFEEDDQTDPASGFELFSAPSPAEPHANDAVPNPAPSSMPADVDEDDFGDEPTSIIRVSTVAASEPAEETTTVAGKRASLICVSTRHAGRQFEITKTEMLIGRTAENDICVPHRSISRHHAKVVVNGRRHQIVDLGSANGTLVNNEEYAQTELKRGDLIELGHVKFRFVPPGETYTFSSEESTAVRAERDDRTVPDGGTATRRSGSTTALVIGVGAALAAAASFAYLHSRSTSQEMLPATVLSQTPPPKSERELDRLVARAGVAMEERRWDNALTIAETALALDPKHPAAQDLAQRATLELEAKKHYDRAVASISGERWRDAWAALQSLPGESVYAEQARDLAEKVRPALIAGDLERAQAAVEEGHWEEARDLVDEIEAIDPGQRQLPAIRAAIDEGEGQAQPGGVAGKPANQPPRSRPKPGRRTTPKARPKLPSPSPSAPAEATTVGEENPRELYLDGAKQLQSGVFAKAIEKFTRCVQADKRFALCYRALGIAYARMGNGPKAARYYRLYLKVDPQARDAEQVRSFLREYESQQPQ